MAVKLVKVGVAAIPGIVEIGEDYFDADPKIVHATRGAEFGIGLIGSLLVPTGNPWEDPLEALMLASEPLVIKSVYNLVSGAIEGEEVSREAIELKLKARGRRRAGQIRPEEMKPQLR